MRVVPLPPAPELEKLLSGLFGRDVKVTAADAHPGALVAVAHYRSDEPVLEVAALVDLPLAAALAAALSVVPPRVVTESAEAGALEAPLRENLAEVMNVVARWVSGSGRRFSLVGCRCPPEAPPPALADLLRASDETRELAVEIAGYGGGRLAFDTL